MKPTIGIFAVLTAALVGCASTRAPGQLVDARVAYQQAQSHPGAQHIGGDLVEARQALDSAERSFHEDGGNNRTRNLAYVAQRKAIAAQAKAETQQAMEQKRVAIAEFDRFRDQQASMARMELERARGQLTIAQQEAQAERQARAAAESKLGQIEGIKSAQTDQGLMITLAGGVLFSTGKSELLPEAKRRLGQVADALKDDKRTILVVGHTDSTGTDATNQRLSEARARAVRTYLVSRGVPDGRIRSEGMGETQPVADNATTEGRASNRRVEMVLENTPSRASTPQQPSPAKAKTAPK